MTTSAEKLAQAEQWRAAGRLDDAQRMCREVLSGNGSDADAWRLLAAIQSAAGQLDAARASLQHAARLCPGDAEIERRMRSLEAAQEYQRAVNLAAQQQTDEAIACLRRALVLAPDFAEAHFRLGALAGLAGRFDEAAQSFRRTLELEPDKVDAHYNLGLALQNQGKPAEAAPHYRRALALAPNHAQAHNQLGMVLQAANELAEAEACYEQALGCAPEYVDAQFNLSGLLLEAGRFAEAERRARRVVERKPDFAEGLYNLGVALAAQHNDEALAVFRRVIELARENVDAHLGLAAELLARGQFAEGWREYEWRLKSPHMPRETLEQPRWSGEPLAGRTILLRAEQGFGDAIQFIRYAEMVKERGAQVVVACTAPIRRLLATARGVDAVVARGELLPTFEVHAPLLSLPGIFQTTPATIPAKVPYLFPSDEAVARWRAELAGERALKIGIAWQGNPVHKRDAMRSFALEHFAGIARLEGVRLYSLQFGPGSEQTAAAGADWPLVDFGERLGDLHDRAALVANLDLVITCDSAPAHLAGALGVPVWTVLAHWADWRWFLDRADSPWYPTMRLFRQPKHGDWASVFAKMEREVGRLRTSRG